MKRDRNWRIIDARPEEYVSLMRLRRAALAANPAAAALDRFAEEYCEYWHAMTPLQRRLADCAIRAEYRPVDLQTGPQKSPRGDHHE
jgi:hypothetical protein